MFIEGQCPPQPLLPGEKREKEWWENIWMYGMGFNLLLMMLVGIFKPDTRCVNPHPLSLQTRSIGVHVVQRAYRVCLQKVWNENYVVPQ